MGEGEGNGLAFAEGLKPAAGMVLVQIVFAGVNLFYKLAINDGMDLSVLVAYRYLFATVSLAPFAFFFRKVSGIDLFCESFRKGRHTVLYFFRLVLLLGLFLHISLFSFLVFSFLDCTGFVVLLISGLK
ncbi:hypothetical protein HPP92_002821 [Vanilla planifolia]|uniref:WAT1-related protein n=1 Tax=Vanilla planifolia TaxID=51239 RepID=A0A835VJA9_VANPL|nr:hypothetical protein HPP92_002821 [Vanilla planifolia]